MTENDKKQHITREKKIIQKVLQCNTVAKAKQFRQNYFKTAGEKNGGKFHIISYFPKALQIILIVMHSLEFARVQTVQ